MENQVSQPVEQTPPAPLPVSNENSNRSFLKTLGIGLSIVSFGIAMAVGGYLYIASKNTPTKIACIMEAKLCPDGTSVGRTGPKCEFSPCPTPTTDPTANWKTYINALGGYSVKYPSDWGILEEMNTNISKSIPTGQISPVAFPQTVNNYGQRIFFGVYENQSSSIDDFVKTNIMAGNDTSFVKYKPITIDGIQGEETTSLPGQTDNDQVFVKKGQRIYDIVWIKSLGGKTITQEIFNQIVSTFKFTTCIPRPACLDATPRCMMPEPENGWCPK